MNKIFLHLIRKKENKNPDLTVGAFYMCSTYTPNSTEATGR